MSPLNRDYPARNKFQLAVGHHEAGRDDAAERICRKILRSHPRDFECNYLLAVIAIGRQDFAAAVEHLRRATSIRPDFIDGFYNMGVALNVLDRHAEAVEVYKRILSLEPKHCDALYNLACALSKLGQHRGAVETFDRLIGLQPQSAEAFDGRGTAFSALKDYEAALQSHEAAISIAPAFAEAHYHRGVALFELDRLEEAKQSYGRAVEIRHAFPEALNSQGVVLDAFGHVDEAIQYYARAIRESPDFAEAHKNKGLALLSIGHFEEGWKEYEWRHETVDAAAPRAFVQELWSGGKSLTGRTLLIHAERGLGDTIQFCRYAKLAKNTGAKVILSVQDSLVRLLQTIDPEITVVDSRTTPIEADLHIPIMSLPLAFNTTPGTIPTGIPYLSAELDKTKEWRRQIGSHGFRIGVAWQGSAGAIDRGRSFPVNLFGDIARLPGVRLLSLQKNFGIEQLASPSSDLPIEIFGPEFDAGEDGFLDTAAVMMAVDLVITSDTAVAHLAGALGRPVWVVLQHQPDWRWGRQGSTNAWYPSMRLFRQPARGDWKGVFSEIGEALSDLLRGNPSSASDTARSPTVPVSWGELIDKITILEIKSERIEREEARLNITTELRALSAAAGAVMGAYPELDELKLSLRAVNERLWSIEDEIREKERMKISMKRSLHWLAPSTPSMTIVPVSSAGLMLSQNPRFRKKRATRRIDRTARRHKPNIDGRLDRI